MAYKVHVKTLSAYEKKLKQARRERGQAKQAVSSLELPTKEQMEEMWGDVLASLNVRMRAVVETEHPKLLSLVGADWFQTCKRFSDAGMGDTLKAALGQCDQEMEELFAVGMLWFVYDMDAQAAKPWG